MHKVSLLDLQPGWGKVVLHSGVHLHYVPPLATHVEVENARTVQLCGARLQLKDVTPVLEDTTVLCSVYGKAKWGRLAPDVDVWVLLHRGLGHPAKQQHITYKLKSIQYICVCVCVCVCVLLLRRV